MSTIPQSANEGTIQLPTLSPYIQRLLRLIKEGTKEHGIVSAQLLGKVTSPSSTSTDACDCILLWDILGRLQSFLYNCSNWINRESASLAMYYVAQNIPYSEQNDFLNQIECKDSETESNSTWLELSDIIKNLDDILKHGQLFLSGEVINEVDENGDECKCNEDVHKLDNLDIYEEKNFLVKMELQRKIISKRLGLTFLQNKEDILDNIISKEDSSGATSEIKSTKKRKREDKERIVYKVEDEDDDDEKKDKNNRLLYILQLQNNPNGGEGKDEQKHINAQRLLAMDLMYHTTHSNWKIRHGAFLGLLSLLRAWKQQQQQNKPTFKRIGKWQMDILSRSTCILCLDQFVDFSILEDVKAPVREICAQYISYCCSVYKDIQNDILVLLLKLLLCHKDEWQIQFGALLVVKYLCAKDASLLLSLVKVLGTESDTTLLSTLHMMCIAQCGHRQNVIPEILNLMTQILLIPFNTNNPQNYSYYQQEKSLKDEILKISCVWLQNSIQQLVSSSLPDEEENMPFTYYTYIVQLFTKLIQWNSNDVFATLQKQRRKKDNHNWMESIFQCYLHLLSNPTTSKEIRISSLICFQFFIPYIGNELLHLIENEEKDWLEHKTVVMYSDALMALFNLFFQDLEKDVLDVLFDTWKSVNLTTCFSSSPKVQLLWKNLYFSFLLKFFNIPDHYSAATTKVTKYVTNNNFQESSIECRIQACHALIQICQTADDALNARATFLDFIPFFITSIFMHSPHYYHVESSLLLYYQYIISIPQTKNNGFLINLCKSVLYDEKCLFYNDDDVNVEELQLYCKSYHKIVKEILFSSSNYDQLNQDMITKKMIDLWEKDNLLPAKQTMITATIRSMRIRAILAGVLIHFSSKSSENTIALLSMKLTPIIRAIVTSIKNECEISRQSLTINDMIQILIILKDNTAIRDKIIYNIVNMSIRQQSEASNMNMTAYQTSRCVLKALFKNSDSEFELLQTQPPIWSLLDPLARINDEYPSILLNEELHYRGLQLMEIVSESAASSVSILNQIFRETMIMNGVTNMACHIHSSKKIKSLATITIINFCTSKEESSHQSIVFESILACLFKKFQNRDRDDLRCNACYLLHSIVASLNVKSLSRVVKCLLPVSMYLMNDEMKECAKSACSMFATLVRVAPLATDDKTNQCLPQFLPPGTVKNTSSQVMDHLLRGLPLPSCTLPHAIQQHLRQNHIVLRPYQREGISWINFLQTVHLHGILWYVHTINLFFSLVHLTFF